jgi:hypothetical protein
MAVAPRRTRPASGHERTIAMPKSVTVEIDTQDLETLKGNNYQLCFAKKVNTAFDVVWQSYNDYLASNTFSWTPLYQLFGTNSFQSGVLVTADTNLQTIELGEQATLDQSGVLGPPATGGPGTGITLINNYGLIHPGLNSVSTGPDGMQRVTPIYVAQSAIETGQDLLTPIDVVQVWFEQDVQTSTMISQAVTNATTVDLTQTDAQTVLYSGGKWSVATLGAVSDPRVYLEILIKGVAVVTAAALAKQIGTYLTGVYQSFSVQVTPSGSQAFKISYKEQKGISARERGYVQLLWDGVGTADYLTAAVLQSLAALNASFTQFDATVPS